MDVQASERKNRNADVAVNLGSGKICRAAGCARNQNLLLRPPYARTASSSVGVAERAKEMRVNKTCLESPPAEQRRSLGLAARVIKTCFYALSLTEQRHRLSASP
jgi:hypothetical protein